MLREVVPAADGGKVFGTRILINEAAKAGLIGLETADALMGLGVVRNLAAHGPEDIDAGKAAEFMALADAAQSALDRDLKTGGKDQPLVQDECRR